MLAPNAAIQLGANGSFVYVVNADSTVSARAVTTGATDSKNTTILTGLAAGENVVIDGVDRLRDGAKVSVRNAASAAAQKPAAAGAPQTPTPTPSATGQGQRQHRHQAQDAGAPSPAASPAQ